MQEKIEIKVIQILKEQLEETTPGITVEPEDGLAELGINSVTFIKLAVRLEEEFGFEFGDEELDSSRFATAGSVIEYVRQRGEKE